MHRPDSWPIFAQYGSFSLSLFLLLKIRINENRPILELLYFQLYIELVSSECDATKSLCRKNHNQLIDYVKVA